MEIDKRKLSWVIAVKIQTETSRVEDA